MRVRVAAALVAAVLGLAVAGCGGGDASGATVNVYVAAPLCAGAESELASHGATAGHYEVAIRCLASSERTGGAASTSDGTDGAASSGDERINLAVVGTNSRRATEDTSSVAVLEPPGPGAKFSRAILESAGVPLLTVDLAAKGMRRVIAAVEGAGTSDVRGSVRDALEPS